MNVAPYTPSLSVSAGRVVAKGLSGGEIAPRTGRSNATISYVLRGGKPSGKAH